MLIKFFALSGGAKHVDTWHTLVFTTPWQETFDHLEWNLNRTSGLDYLHNLIILLLLTQYFFFNIMVYATPLVDTLDNQYNFYFVPRLMQTNEMTNLKNRAFSSRSHQTRNRQNRHVLISSEQRQEESERRRSWRRMDTRMHRHEDQGMFSQCFCELAMLRCKLQRRCANIWVCWTAKMEERNREEERNLGLWERGAEETGGWIKKVGRGLTNSNRGETKYTERWIEEWTDIRAECGVVVLSVHL